jgi:hypothetical protein
MSDQHDELQQLQEKVQLLLSERKSTDRESVPVQYRWVPDKRSKYDSDSEHENSSDDEGEHGWSDATTRTFLNGKWSVSEGVQRLLNEEDDTKHERTLKLIKRVSRKYKEPVGGWAKSAKLDSTFTKYNNYAVSSTIQKDDERQQYEERRLGVIFKYLATLDWRLETLAKRAYESQPYGISPGATRDTIASIQSDNQEFTKYVLSQKQHIRKDRRNKLAERAKAPAPLT